MKKKKKENNNIKDSEEEEEYTDRDIKENLEEIEQDFLDTKDVKDFLNEQGKINNDKYNYYTNEEGFLNNPANPFIQEINKIDSENK